MDSVQITRQQLVALNKLANDVVISAVNEDARLIYVERLKYVGNRGEGKWMLPSGKWRDGAQRT